MVDQEKQYGLSELYRKWRPALIAFFRRRVADSADAEDLAHDTLVRVMAADVTGDQMQDGYVFRTAQNLLIDRARRQKIRNSHARSEALAGHDLFEIDPERALQGREEVAHLIEVLEQLPERTRSIFFLYRLENMSQSEIGETFGISASAVKQQVAKVMATLAKKMRDEQ